MRDKEKTTLSEQSSSQIAIQKGNSEVLINDEGTEVISAEKINIRGIIVP